MSSRKSSKQSKIIRKALKEEKSACEKLGCEHKGGPGHPDCICSNGAKVEVKHRKRKMTKPELDEYAVKGIEIIVSNSGFTKPALYQWEKKYRSFMTLCDSEQCYT